MSNWCPVDWPLRFREPVRSLSPSPFTRDTAASSTLRRSTPVTIRAMGHHTYFESFPRPAVVRISSPPSPPPPWPHRRHSPITTPLPTTSTISVPSTHTHRSGPSPRRRLPSPVSAVSGAGRRVYLSVCLCRWLWLWLCSNCAARPMVMYWVPPGGEPVHAGSVGPDGAQTGFHCYG